MEEPQPSDNLYVQNLPPGVTDQIIKALFGEGVRQVRILPSYNEQTDHRVALVRMSSVEEATMIRNQANGVTPEGCERALNIRFAGKPGGGGNTSGWGKASATGGSMGSPYGGAGKGSTNPPSDNLYVRGLPAGMTSEIVTQMFASHGTVVQCKVIDGPEGSNACHALVRFASVEEATSVKELFKEGGQMEGCDEPINIEFAFQKDKGGGKAGGGFADGKGGGKGCGKGKLGIAEIVKGVVNIGCLPGSDLGNNDNCLYVGGLPPDSDDFHLYKLFATFGAIKAGGVLAMKNEDGTCKGFGFVNFVDAQAVADAASLLDGLECPDGTILTVRAKNASKGKK